jgi:hypothetical protein
LITMTTDPPLCTDDLTEMKGNHQVNIS